MQDQEIESKFLVRDLQQMRARLEAEKAVLVQPRVFEKNLRFENDAGDFGTSGRVLRLRMDDRTHLTYKAAGQVHNGVASRREIDFVVEDFDRAQQFLQALGFHVSAEYEKYRAVYVLDAAHVMLDELPFGSFVEIEADDASHIDHAAAALGLRRDAAIGANYLTLFARLCRTRDLDAHRLTFEALQGKLAAPSDLDAGYADE